MKKVNKEKILTVNVNKTSIIVKHEDWDMCNQTYSKNSSFEYVIISALKGTLKVKEKLKTDDLLNIKKLLEKNFKLEMGKKDINDYYVEIIAKFEDGSLEQPIYFNQIEKEKGIDYLLVEADNWAALIVDRVLDNRI